jgi:hypothetical protein
MVSYKVEEDTRSKLPKEKHHRKTRIINTVGERVQTQREGQDKNIPDHFMV